MVRNAMEASCFANLATLALKFITKATQTEAPCPSERHGASEAVVAAWTAYATTAVGSSFTTTGSRLALMSLMVSLTRAEAMKIDE